MGPNTHYPSFLKQLLPAILISAAMTGLSLALSAQQTTSSANSNPSPQQRLNDPDLQVTPEGIGDAMLVKQRYQAALEAYKDATSDSPQLWNKRGIAYQMLSDLKDAERCYKQSLRRDPNFSWALNNLGSIYDAQGDFRKSEAIYRKALAIAPDSPRIAANLGTSLMVQKKYKEGAQQYKRALALDPEIFDESEGPVYLNSISVEQRGAVNYYKAKDFAQAGMVDRALKYLRKALSEGFADVTKITQDRSFDNLQGNAAFDRLIAEHSK